MKKAVQYFCKTRPQFIQQQGKSAAASGHFYQPQASRRHFSSRSHVQFEPVKSAKILFGSQTGTAHMFAEDLSEALAESNVASSVIDLADVNPKTLFEGNAKSNDEILVFVTACYGTGEPTDNAKSFYQYCMSNSLESLNNVKYTIFGLGNSKSFPERYNVVSRNLRGKFDSNGATRVFEHGEGDSAHCIEKEFEDWKASLVEAIKKDSLNWGGSSSSAAATPQAASASASSSAVDGQVCPGVMNSVPDKSQKYVFNIYTPSQLEKLQAEKQKNNTLTTVRVREHVRLTDFSQDITAKNPLYCSVKSEVNLCPQSPRMKKQIVFSLPQNQLIKYEHGDHVGIWPRNSTASVEALAKRMNVNLDDYITVEAAPGFDLAPPFVSTIEDAISIRTLLYEFYDLNSTLLPQTYKNLAAFATNESEKKTLMEVTTATSGVNLQYVKEHMLNIVEILNMFPSVNIPFDRLLLLLPRVQPRYYSISSSPKFRENEMTISIGAHVVQRAEKSPFKGLCSHYLCGMQVGNQAAMYTRTSDFRLPKDCTSTPILCVAGGTGIAPFMSFVEERKAQLRANPNIKFAPSVLFYGVRDESEYMYKAELEEALKLGIFSNIYVAYSFTQNKMISDVVYEQQKLCWDLLNKGANLYICGGIQGFGDSVYNTLKRIAARYGHDSDAFIQKMRQDSRCYEDLAA